MPAQDVGDVLPLVAAGERRDDGRPGAGQARAGPAGAKAEGAGRHHGLMTAPASRIGWIGRKPAEPSGYSCGLP